MTWRENVGRWHGGQLVIVWLLLLMFGSGSVLGGFAAADALDQHSNSVAREAVWHYRDSVWKASPEGQARASTLKPGVVDFGWIDDSTFESATESDAYSVRQQVSTRYRHYINAVGVPLIILFPLAAFAVGLLLTWVWLGARSSGTRGQNGVS